MENETSAGVTSRVLAAAYVAVHAAEDAAEKAEGAPEWKNGRYVEPFEEAADKIKRAQQDLDQNEAAIEQHPAELAKRMERVAKVEAALAEAREAPARAERLRALSNALDRAVGYLHQGKDPEGVGRECAAWLSENVQADGIEDAFADALAALLALQHPEGLGNSIRDLQEAKRRASNAAIAAAGAAASFKPGPYGQNPLAALERALEDATRGVESEERQPPWREKRREELAAALDEAKQGLARLEADKAAALSHHEAAQKHLDAVHEAISEEVAPFASEVIAYRVKLQVYADGEKIAPWYDGVADELRPIMANWHAGLRKLGCVVSCSGGEAGLFLLVRGDAGVLGKADEQGRVCIGRMEGGTLESMPGAEIEIIATAECVGLDAAFCDLVPLTYCLEADHWGAERTPALVPQRDECPGDWLMRAPIPAEKLALRRGRLEAVACRLDLFGGLLDPHAEEDGASYIVQGMIDRQKVTILAGRGGTGKSTLGQSLLMAAGSVDGPKEFLGRPVLATCSVGLLAGEEDTGAIARRQRVFSETWGDVPLHIRRARGAKAYKAALASLDGVLKDGVLLIDSFTKMWAGNPLDAQDVSAFYDPLMEFAERNNCAAVVIHHFNEGHGFNLDRLRGSSSHGDNARMVIGMEKRRGGIAVGTLKHNLPPKEVWSEEGAVMMFQRDDDTERLTPFPDAKASANDDAEDFKPAILAASARLNAEGRRVNKSGKQGLYRLGAPEVAGIGRNALESAIAELIDAGELIANDGGLFVAAEATDEAA